MATMEPENETQEMQQFFHNLSDSRSIDARYNQTEGGRAVAYLDASRGRDYGPVWSKELAQGDSLHAAVLGMLYDPKEKPKLRDLLSGIGKQNSLLTSGELTSMTSTSSLGLQPLWLALQLARQLEKAPVPESYLGYILYDQDSIRYDSGRVEISRQAFTNPEELALDITATQGGFVEVYVYNSSDLPVWYDQFSISSSQAVIIQENHYYPFGMQIAGLELDLDSRNRYLYQGKELQEDHDLNTLDFHWRVYDPAIGRTFQMDPHTENYYNWSPYSWAFNNPLNIIDPDGRDGVATIDKEKKTLEVSQTFHYSKGNAEVLLKALSNLGDGSMTIDEFMADYNSNWGGESSTVEIDGEDYSVGYSATFVAHDNDASRDRAVADDPTSNSLIFDRDMGSAGRWNGRSRSITINPLKVRYDNTTFSHEIAHSLGILGHDPNRSRDDQGNELSGGISSYAWNRQVSQSERKATIYDAVNLSKTVKDTKVRVHIRGYWSKNHKNAPTIIK